LNSLFRSRKAAGFCVYDTKAWPASVVRDVLRTHPIAVVGDLVCKRNLYFERPDLIDQVGSAESQVSWMLAQLRELQAQEARLQVALEAGQLGSWELDLDADTSVRSLRHDRIFGYDHLHPHWGRAVFMQHVLPEDRDQVDAAFEQALKDGGTLHFECRIRRHNDGAVRWIEAYGRPDAESRKGSVRRLLGIVSDITERKELEQALRDADRRKDEFLATLAHELRNPLAPILNAVQLMHLKNNSADPQLKRVHGIIERQVQHLGRLVDDLLDVSRITTGRIVLQKERVNLRTVLLSAVEASQPLIEAARHAFLLSLPQEPVHLEGDATRLAQVFLNLLNNAAKYTPAGGRIELEALRDGDQVVVRVKDNGVGILPERIPDMFQMFVQGHRSGERVQGGLGIGLPLAKKLLELHGGSIEAYSQGRGAGSEFTVRLPVAEGRPALSEEAVKSLPDEEGFRLGRILVVDDNIEAADTLAETLELLGQEVSVRYDGRTALEAAAQLRPDVVILDIGLPDIDGYEVARQLQLMKPRGLLVALTGWGQEKDRQLAREAGFDLHRTKPLDPRELLMAVMALQPRLGHRP
uniref:ATP-binding protein n=1 Tax=Caldimonas tepidiphila TaxID=2315841 RepID=UPI000E5B8FCD